MRQVISLLFRTGMSFVSRYKWLLIAAGIAVSHGAVAWAAHDWTRASWSSKLESHLRAQADAQLDAHRKSLREYQARVAEARSLAQQSEDRIARLNRKLEDAQNETQVIYRDVVVRSHDIGECHVAADGWGMLTRAIRASNANRTAYAVPGETDPGDADPGGAD